MAQRENVHPFRESPLASRENFLARWRSSSKAQLPNPSSNVRPPSSRIRTCSPYRCRRPKLSPHWLRRPQNVSRRLSDPPLQQSRDRQEAPLQVPEPTSRAP